MVCCGCYITYLYIVTDYFVFVNMIAKQSSVNGDEFFERKESEIC